MNFYSIGDLLGLAVADEIILVQPANGGLRKDPIRVRDAATGKMVAAGNKSIRPRYEYACAYDIIDAEAALTLHFGALINTDYFLTGANIQMSNGAWCRVGLNFMKLSAPAKFSAADSAPFDIVVPAGFGVVNLLGCTVGAGGEAIAGGLQVSVQRGGDNLLGATSADYQAGAVTISGGEIVKNLSATAAITLPNGAQQLSGDENEGDDGALIYAASWMDTPTYL